MNTIKFKIKKSNKLESLVSEIKSFLLKKEDGPIYNSNITKLCSNVTIVFCDSNTDNAIEISLEKIKTNTNSKIKNIESCFLFLLNNYGFQIKDIISIDYLNFNKNKIVHKKWRDVRKSREEKYRIIKN